MMYVRFIGTKVCWTVMDGSGRFYMGDVDEATQEELETCNRGGGELPLSNAINAVAS